jgi:hypothetical protein
LPLPMASSHWLLLHLQEDQHPLPDVNQNTNSINPSPKYSNGIIVRVTNVRVRVTTTPANKFTIVMNRLLLDCPMKVNTHRMFISKQQNLLEIY